MAAPALHGGAYAVSGLLPPTVAVVEVTCDLDDVALAPIERAQMCHAVPSRYLEFATTRACAHAALAALGSPAAAVGRGRAGEPLWPDGFVGSLTHCAGYRGAAVARSAGVVALGIDVEVHRRLPEGVPAMVASPTERAMLGRLAVAVPGVHWDTVLFSAKESIYKAWYPLARRWLGFDQVSLRIDPATSTFRAHLLVPGPDLPGGEPLREFRGALRVGGGIVATALWVSA